MGRRRRRAGDAGAMKRWSRRCEDLGGRGGDGHRRLGASERNPPRTRLPRPPFSTFPRLPPPPLPARTATSTEHLPHLHHPSHHRSTTLPTTHRWPTFVAVRVRVRVRVRAFVAPIRPAPVEEVPKLTLFRATVRVRALLEASDIGNSTPPHHPPPFLPPSPPAGGVPRCVRTEHCGVQACGQRHSPKGVVRPIQSNCGQHHTNLQVG